MSIEESIKISTMTSEFLNILEQILNRNQCRVQFLSQVIHLIQIWQQLKNLMCKRISLKVQFLIRKAVWVKILRTSELRSLIQIQNQNVTLFYYLMEILMDSSIDM
jgi:hypothetical protein